MFYTHAQHLSYERQTATSYDIFFKLHEAVKSFRELENLINASTFKDHAEITQQIKNNNYKIEDLIKKIDNYQSKEKYYTLIKSLTKDVILDNIERNEINIFNNEIFAYYSKEQLDEEIKTLDYYRKLLNIKNKGKHYVQGCITKFEKLHTEAIEKKQQIENENETLQLEADKIKAEMTPKKLEKIKNEVKDAEARYVGRPMFGYSKVFMLSNTLTGYFEKFGHIKENPIINEFRTHVLKSVSDYESRNPRPMIEYTQDIKMVRSFVEAYANERIVINEKPEDICKYEVVENENV